MSLTTGEDDKSTVIVVKVVARVAQGCVGVHLRDQWALRLVHISQSARLVFDFSSIQASRSLAGL